jgi:2,3-bisphosphoglycerate-independent phosphoglycerate mutase
MKHIILLGDGMADRPLQDHDQKTPLNIGRTPCMDQLAACGTLGMVSTIPEGFDPGSDVANMCVLGYDPKQHYTGRAPIEAVSMGIPLSDGDIAFRCNLVSFAAEVSGTIMDDYSAGHITTAAAHKFISMLKNELDSVECTLHPGISYRHLMVYKNADSNITTCPPHDITGQNIESFFPKGPGAASVCDCMQRSRQLLTDHPLNRERLSQGEKPVSSIWLWGQGTAVQLPSFQDKYGLGGSVISAVDLIKGLGISAGLHSIEVPGATGYLDTNYSGKVSAALEALETQDFVYLHVEAPDEASHKGSFAEKIQAIDDFDCKIVGPVLNGLRQSGETFRILVLPDHSTPLSLKTHSSEPVPFVLYDSTDTCEKPMNQSYCEADAMETGMCITEGWTLMDRLIRSD